MYRKTVSAGLKAREESKQEARGLRPDLTIARLYIWAEERVKRSPELERDRSVKGDRVGLPRSVSKELLTDPHTGLTRTHRCPVEGLCSSFPLSSRLRRDDPDPKISPVRGELKRATASRRPPLRARRLAAHPLPAALEITLALSRSVQIKIRWTGLSRRPEL